MERKIIAVCGKGGVGKTAFTSMMTKVLSQQQSSGKLLVIDADPALGLPFSLGLTTDLTIGKVREEIIKAAQAGETDQTAIVEKLDYMIFKALVEEKGFSFLAMGCMDKKGCFCALNDLLRDAIAQLSNTFDTILIDGEAGLEQINRQVVDKVNTLIIVTDTSYRGMQTVKHIKQLVDNGCVPACDQIGVVLNRGKDSVTPLETMAQEIGVPILGIIPYDRLVEKHDFAGKPLLKLPEESLALQAVTRIAKHINQL
ncbi:AAA family ATPase [Sporomusa acidovorans]|uniref:AAA domain-containing protein n=1 Tax=Sporomusa acidovorans (strain ATCC 49682 / DSM 3132 / Mol) TaxID=1123286 RepID=A0ABZ3J096_SPOA4|nr:AAA family ATPase [Sporomusa acidovorans]OZC21389.1 light-independent protochlorophyllide reductase iron-sulfur ATP-binding protein [Sporomusa acidovorans DSM 3132]SDE55600.1 CO dehydrogenase maturation factor [Sporomusa acidovorans]